MLPWRHGLRHELLPVRLRGREVVHVQADDLALPAWALEVHLQDGALERNRNHLLPEERAVFQREMLRTGSGCVQQHIWQPFGLLEAFTLSALSIVSTGQPALESAITLHHVQLVFAISELLWEAPPD